MSGNSKTPSFIIGVDPGTAVTGYGIIRRIDNRFQAVDYGCIRPPANRKLSERYLIIFEGLEELLTQHRPEVLVVETQFIQKNVQSAIKLGMARGIAILAATRQGLPVFEYTPRKAKQSVVGNGSASKQQVQRMIQQLLGLRAPPPEDAADALALAICHGHANPLSAIKEV